MVEARPAFAVHPHHIQRAEEAARRAAPVVVEPLDPKTALVPVDNFVCTICDCVLMDMRLCCNCGLANCNGCILRW